jgi:hypothetical protein
MTNYWKDVKLYYNMMAEKAVLESQKRQHSNINMFPQQRINTQQ